MGIQERVWMALLQLAEDPELDEHARVAAAEIVLEEAKKKAKRERKTEEQSA